MPSPPAIHLRTSISLSLPDWLLSEMSDGSIPEFLPQVEDQMRLALRLSRRNVEEETGGPFGALIVEVQSGRLVGVGVNRVVPLTCSLYHAETVAISMAQALFPRFTLGAEDMPAHALISSAQPCSMCFGATLWSGVSRLVCGATREDVESITGFDEGPLVENWREELEKRGIEVLDNICRDEATAVLEKYIELNGVVYNGSSAKKP